jgi:hypothetical protein
MQGAAKYPQELWPMTGTIATTIVLVVSPSLNADGRNAYSTRGQLFDGKVDRRVIVTRTKR